jgi:hypothetical protein
MFELFSQNKRPKLLVLTAVLASALLLALPARAQMTDEKIDDFVEALRRAAPDTGMTNDGLYSDWQIKPENIPRWSRLCIEEEMTPAQFEANETKARAVLACVMGDILKQEYQNSNNEALAVRRAAAWWMSGDPNRYDTPNIAEYTEKVWDFYQEERGR